MANPEVWLDFDQIRHNIKNNTVDRLKQILTGFNEECFTHFSKTGKKQDIIDRITQALDGFRGANSEDRWQKAKNVIIQVRNTGVYTPSRLTAQPAVVPSSHATYPLDNKSTSYGSSVGSTSNVATYDPYVPAARKVLSTSAPTASGSGSRATTAIRFKDSPFFTIDQMVSQIIECPESTSATDRRQSSLNFTLNADQLGKLKAPGSKYQLRLFCTSSIFYAGTNTFRSNLVPCPVEFPPTCEVRVNNTPVTANLKGLKKKPGTAPPPDIGKYVRLSSTSNRVEMVYVNSQQPVQSKKFYLVIMLVEGTKIDNLVADLKEKHYRSSIEIQQKMIRALNEDDDIVAGPQKMSVKCPLTFVRINTPCRSSKCVHPQCFDAVSWFTMMEQTTTWLCPVCERILDPKDLIIDGYFDTILRETPDSVEDVIVEADGEWHTSDNKYASPKWKALHPPGQLPSSRHRSQSPPRPSIQANASEINGKGKAPMEIFILDSDDEDEGRVKQELSPSYASSTNQSFEGTLPPPSQAPTQLHTVIDLTLDTDDEGDDDPPPTSHPPLPPPPPPPVAVLSTSKRTASDADMSPQSDQLWKKGRTTESRLSIDSSRILPPPQRSAGIPSNQQPLSPSNHQPLSPGNRQPLPFQGNLPPLPFERYPSGSSLQLPPIQTGPFIARNNNSTSSSSNRWQ